MGQSYHVGLLEQWHFASGGIVDVSEESRWPWPWVSGFHINKSK